jgi:DNA-binding IclR family transcriptional regulator
MVTASPLRLFHTWHEHQKANRTDRLAERILSEMRRRQAEARTELPFSAERLTKLFGAEPAGVFRALRKLECDRLIFRDDMTGRWILTDKPLLKR